MIPLSPRIVYRWIVDFDFVVYRFVVVVPSRFCCYGGIRSVFTLPILILPVGDFVGRFVLLLTVYSVVIHGCCSFCYVTDLLC